MKPIVPSATLGTLHCKTIVSAFVAMNWTPPSRDQRANAITSAQGTQMKNAATLGEIACTNVKQLLQVTNLECLSGKWWLVRKIGKFSIIGFLGCYLDTVDRQLNGTYMRLLDNNPQKCEAHCTVDDYKYFAMQDHTYCSCGNELNSSVKKADNECNNVCPGDMTKKCGSQWRNSLYQRR